MKLSELNEQQRKRIIELTNENNKYDKELSRMQGILRPTEEALMVERNDRRQELLEIIRWLVNKDCAKHPFKSDITQRDNNYSPKGY
jgi:hypothetical protein